MSDTNKTYKGISYRDNAKNKVNHKRSKRKFFGFTSGTHSQGSNEVMREKGVDFVKYGYPCDLRGKHEKLELLNEREANEEIRKQIEGEGEE